jgi:Amt family ammonium transporter
LIAAFKDQVSLDVLFSDLFYAFAAMCVVLVVLALCLIDGGLVRTKNIVDTWLLKIAAAMVAGLGTIFIGYAIWQWSFNSAFGVPNPLGQALKDWWLFGHYMTKFGGNIDPKALPEADVNQIFVVFFMTFSMATMALIHSAVVERMKALPLLVMAAIIGLVLSPLAGYLCWGPVSPLTNRGVHDFDGVFPLYIFAGTFSLVLAWRLKPRRGIGIGGVPSAQERPHANIAGVGAGILLIMFALPFIALGSGWLVPGAGFFGISMTTSGIGIVTINILTSFVTGGTVGTLIAYRRRQPAWILLGALSSAILCGALFDVAKPWEILLVSLAGPFVTVLGQLVMARVGIDDPKVVPLALFNGVIGAVLTGFVAWHTKTGGFFGLTGKYGFQHAQITPWWQVVGVLAIMALAGIPALVLSLVFERTTGLGFDDAGQDAGLDHANWDAGPLLPAEEPILGPGSAVTV